MTSRFIPYFHYEHPSDKMTPEWCMKVVNYCYYNYYNENLLARKNLKEIEEYFTGDIDMRPYQRMFKSIQKAMESNDVKYITSKISSKALTWEPIALIPQKMNSALASINKIPIEVVCEAQDALAMKKKNEDIEFLKNKEIIENELQDIAEQMQLGKVDLGGPVNGAKKYSSMPMGLDLNDPDEENIFSQLLYSLDVEKANEKALEQIYNIKKADRIRYLESIDLLKYGVSAHQTFRSAITGLPDIEYVYPGNIDLPPSEYPDYRDNTHRIISKDVTVLELFNHFSDEIKNKETLEKIINGDHGYCKRNGYNPQYEGVWGTFRVHIKYFEVKSIDWLGVVSKNKMKREVKYFTTDESKATYKIYGQNTYCFWWLLNTNYVFGIKKLGFAYRTKGNESYQNFSTNIYKSQKKSATEIAIGLNKQAQIAYIKLEYCLIKSLPPGKYIDLKFLRNAVEGLKKEDGNWTQEDLLNLAWESNYLIGDSEGFDGMNAGQIKPFIDIQGGLRDEINGYWNTILRANEIIGGITGINEAFTGIKAEELVGLQELRINSALNAIYYATEALQCQYQNLFNIWAYELSSCIEAGGKIKEAVERLIGVHDTELLNGLEQTPLHNLTIKVILQQRDFERAKYINQLTYLKQRGIITTADEYMLDAINNPKERMAYLAVKEKRYMKQLQRERQEDFMRSQELIKQQGENKIMELQAEGAEKTKQIYAQGEVEARIIQLANQLGMTKAQMEAIAKLAIQRERSRDQKDKLLSAIREKKALDNQKAL